MSTPPVISNSAASNGNNGDNVGYSVSESGFNMTRNGRNNGFRSSAGSKFANWINSPNSTCVSGNGNYGNNDPNLPFRQWKAETICSWLDNLGKAKNCAAALFGRYTDLCLIYVFQGFTCTTRRFKSTLK